ncbi:ABC transporter substrate-binding protein [Terribacillus saccharophilus]|uniref:ABC transporter substrate-binding protein n=1 Tax=Terribacillus saccharophilus TaxID=361277 RepID=UPI000BA72ACD|nr:ABC transporter substrate-binding protein [Terribacillus saccharophilus]PAF19377.1 ABC transporter substrate-binding protein [Terribacillus saccharophilus]
MNKFKKFLSLFCVTVLLVGLLAGCGGANSSSASEEEDTVTVLISNDSSRNAIEAVTDYIEEEHGIKTVFETRPGGTEGDNIMKTRLATGDMADIAFYNSGSLLQALNPAQNFVDLSKEPYMDKVLDTFKETVSDDSGAIYGIPATSVMVGAWFYNKKVYEELGLEIPKTWDDLMENNEKIKTAGKTAVIGSYKETWTSQLIVLGDNYNVLAEDPTFPEEYTANKANLATTPGALRSFEKLQEVYDKGYMNDDFLATTYDTGTKMLAEGTGVHYPMLSQVLPLLETNYPDQLNDIGVFPQPGDSPDKNGFTAWMPHAFYLNKNGEKVETAKKWAEAFLSDEGVKRFVDAATLDGPLAVEGVDLPEDVPQAVKDMLPYFEEGNTAPALEFLSPLKGPNLEQITTEVGSGGKTAEEGAKLYDQDVEKQAKQLGLEGW